MALVEKSVLVGYSAQRMFKLVDLVEDYPAFLPWCGGAEVKERDENVTLATIHINYHHVKQSFTTENQKQSPQMIVMNLREGPFSKLDGKWHFLELGEDACKIHFTLHYEFSSKVLEKLLSPVFEHITNTFVDAFVQRAEKVYG